MSDTQWHAVSPSTSTIKGQRIVQSYQTPRPDGAFPINCQPQPVLSDEHVFFGSSADDTLRALHRPSGQLAWSFTADGPIRYAPLLVDGAILFGSDDGHVYCLRQTDGSLRWTTRLVRSDRRIPGNGRLISPWPVRTGLVRHGDSVFATAGLYPSEGTHAFRIRFDDILARMTRRHGIAVIAGLKNGELLDRLRHETQFHLVGIDPDPDRVDHLRKRNLAAGDYGSRVSLYVLAAPSLPMTPWMATLVASEVAEPPWDRDALWQLCSPDGGMLWLPAISEGRVRGPLPGSGRWVQDLGAIVNPTLTLGGDRLWAVVNAALGDQARDSGRMAVREFLQSEAEVLCLSTTDGEVRWRRSVPESMRPVSNILYGLHHADRYILTGSRPGSDGDSWYELACLEASNGNTVWTASHPKGMPGANYHGEQLHHPAVVAEQWLLAEPFLYDLMSGKRIGQDGATPWKLVRPGHSCGTVSSANTCIFFRAGNPTVLNVAPSMDNPTEPKALAPTRPGCWINMISAGGLLLVPEASAGCVCHFSLQTSMAFRSRVPRNQ